MAQSECSSSQLVSSLAASSWFFRLVNASDVGFLCLASIASASCWSKQLNQQLINVIRQPFLKSNQLLVSFIKLKFD